MDKPPGDHPDLPDGGKRPGEPGMLPAHVEEGRGEGRAGPRPVPLEVDPAGGETDHVGRPGQDAPGPRLGRRLPEHNRRNRPAGTVLSGQLLEPAVHVPPERRVQEDPAVPGLGEPVVPAGEVACGRHVRAGPAVAAGVEVDAPQALEDRVQDIPGREMLIGPVGEKRRGDRHATPPGIRVPPGRVHGYAEEPRSPRLLPGGRGASTPCRQILK